MNKMKLGNNVRWGWIQCEWIGFDLEQMKANLLLIYYPVKSIWKEWNDSLYFRETCIRLFIDVQGEWVMRAVLSVSWYTNFQ